MEDMADATTDTDMATDVDTVMDTVEAMADTDITDNLNQNKENNARRKVDISQNGTPKTLIISNTKFDAYGHYIKKVSRKTKR